jgi:hypothetical protein
MRSYGDIPIEHRKLVEELEILERWFHAEGGGVPPLLAAKGMVAMASDYFCIEMEEEGDRLLYAAEKYYPGYFKGPIYTHINKDAEFDHLIYVMKKTIGIKTMRSLGFEG